MWCTMRVTRQLLHLKPPRFKQRFYCRLTHIQILHFQFASHCQRTCFGILSKLLQLDLAQVYLENACPVVILQHSSTKTLYIYYHSTFAGIHKLRWWNWLARRLKFYCSYSRGGVLLCATTTCNLLGGIWLILSISNHGCNCVATTRVWLFSSSLDIFLNIGLSGLSAAVVRDRRLLRCAVCSIA